MVHGGPVWSPSWMIVSRVRTATRRCGTTRSGIKTKTVDRLPGWHGLSFSQRARLSDGFGSVTSADTRIEGVTS